MSSQSIRRVVASAVALLVVTSGCTKTVEIPWPQYEAASADTSSTYRIRMTTNHEYVVRRFSVADSTLVISELGPSDANYRLAKVPITVPMKDVESIAKVEGRAVVPLIVLGTVAVTIAVLYAMFGGGYPSN